jgi:hypothetical protein
MGQAVDQAKTEAAVADAAQARGGS